MFDGADQNSFENADTKLGPLKLNSVDFVSVLKIFKKRYTSLVTKDGYRPENLIKDNMSQSRLSFLNKPDTGKGDKKPSKYNLLKKTEDEEATQRSVYNAMINSPSSSDNPIDKPTFPESHWGAFNSDHLEYIYRESVEYVHSENNTSINRMRFITGEPMGNSPSVLTIRLHIRLVQCLAMNVVWFLNRLFQDIVSLGLETRALGRSSSKAGNPVWSDCNSTNRIGDGNISRAMEFLRKNSSSWAKVDKEPSFIVVEFDIVDNLIGVVNTDAELRGAACPEWTCYSNTDNEKYGMTSGISNMVEDRDCTENTKNFTHSFPTTVSCEDLVDTDPLANLGELSSVIPGSKFNNYEPLKAGTDTVKIYNTSNVEISLPAKGNELKSVMKHMVALIGRAVRKLDDCHMYNGVLIENTRTYESSELFLPLTCTNPSLIYRIAYQLFVTVVLTCTRSLRQTFKSDILPQNNPRANPKYAIEFGYEDTTFSSTSFASGRLRISTRMCECKIQCSTFNEPDNARTLRYMKNYGSSLSVDEQSSRHHNSHRHIPYDLSFWNKNRKKIGDLFQSSDECSHDIMSECYTSTQLHHIFCGNVLMVYRGDNFHINQRNNCLDVHHKYRNGGKYGDGVCMRQLMDNASAVQDISATKIRRRDDVVNKLGKRYGDNISVRDSANMIAKVVSQLTTMTRYLCNICNHPNNGKEFEMTIFRYTDQCYPLIEILLTFCEHEKLNNVFEKYKEARDARTEAVKDSGGVLDDSPLVAAILKAAIRFFICVVDFVSKGYNASVSSAINRRGYLVSTTSISGFRYHAESVKPEVEFHEVIGTMNSSVCYADFFSFSTNSAQRTDDDTCSFLGGLGGLESFIGSGSNQKDSIRDDKNISTLFSIYADEILKEDNDGIVEVGEIKTLKEVKDVEETRVEGMEKTNVSSEVEETKVEGMKKTNVSLEVEETKVEGMKKTNVSLEVEETKVEGMKKTSVSSEVEETKVEGMRKTSVSSEVEETDDDKEEERLYLKRKMEVKRKKAKKAKNTSPLPNNDDSDSEESYDFH
uniref:Wsv285-like protein n=1 Tax=Chionoecetes opilio bacilliform virus TaxID=1825681 RepID=A0A1Q3DL94_9VIRU|nr:wsv285-like protein [Chionoecetes opilio bacilliform virus]GAV93241.1 hypothetical protein SCV_121 [Chionoecetes opilio bacilliform virus]